MINLKELLDEYDCRKCGYPFEKQRDWQAHEKICSDVVFLDEPEPVETNNAPSYKSLLEDAAKRDPLYKRYVGRIHILEPNNMWEACKKVIYNKDL